MLIYAVISISIRCELLDMLLLLRINKTSCRISKSPHFTSKTTVTTDFKKKTYIICTLFQKRKLAAIYFFVIHALAAPSGLETSWHTSDYLTRSRQCGWLVLCALTKELDYITTRYPSWYNHKSSTVAYVGFLCGGYWALMFMRRFLLPPKLVIVRLSMLYYL